MAKKYKLNGDKLEFIAENYVTFRKKSAPKKLYIEMVDSDSGKRAYGFLSRIYPVKTYDTIWGGWGDFDIIFNSEADRNAAYDDMKGAIDEWEKAQYEAEQNEDDDTPPTPSNIDDEEEQEQTVDYTPYVVVGAAVLIIIVLLWPQN